MQKADETFVIPAQTAEVKILAGHGLYDDIVKISRLLDCRIAIIADEAIAHTYGKVLQNGLNAELFPFVGGEASKTRETKERFEDDLLTAKFGRDTLLIGLGGGVVTDFTAFIASTYMRGIPLILIPTTLLAMVDAAIGGKTGVDTPLGKNLIGTFYHPKHIFIDLSYLASLPEKEWMCGLSEIIKYGLTASSSIWELLTQHPADWKQSLFALILASIRLKMQVVASDPMELTGLRRILNFGHTIAHALEVLSNFEMSHGQAVAIGCIAESRLSYQLGYLSEGDLKKISNLFKQFPFTLRLPRGFETKAMLEAMQRDKKAKGQSARFVLIDQISKVLPFHGDYCRAVPEPELETLIDWMRNHV